MRSRAAAALGIADKLVAGPRSTQDLAEACGVQAGPCGACSGTWRRWTFSVKRSQGTSPWHRWPSSSYVGGMAEMQSAHGYHLWGSLTEALRTGAPQTEAKGDFRLLYRDPDRMRRYFRAMSAGSLMAARQIAGLSGGTAMAASPTSERPRAASRSRSPMPIATSRVSASTFRRRRRCSKSMSLTTGCATARGSAPATSWSIRCLELMSW